MSRKVVSLLMIALVVFASTAMLMPQQAQAQTPTNPGSGIIIPFTQTVTGGTGALANAASIVGTYTIHSFQAVGNTLQSVGTITANVLDAAGNVLGTVTTAATGTVTSSTGSCQILTLDIGAINLNLLGLVVNLSPIHLNITAQSGSGNLLGNLLCSVANLLNNNGPLGQVAGLLNNILRQL